MRRSGILMHITSLPSPYGIGTLGKEAYEFVDFLVRAGQSYWQILPLGQTGYGDSPYQSCSTYAGNPYLIDLRVLAEEGYLTAEEIEAVDWGKDAEHVDFAGLYEKRYPLLRKAFARFCEQIPADYDAFGWEQGQWLEDYALYMAIKTQQGGGAWDTWEEDLRLRRPEAIAEAKKELGMEMFFWKMLQYFFFRQWRQLKRYANDKGVKIIGDIPIYVAADSADVWASPWYFALDEEGHPKEVAGCPPDAFSEDGQLWGNPIYRWDVLQKDGYGWWVERLRHSLTLYDMVRIDHFRGFDSYFCIPYGHKTARKGYWRKGPGMELFRVLQDRLGKLPLIAEDLGYLTPSVLRLLADSGYPGMKVLQFAFGSDEANAYLPHHHTHNAVIYTGTHDNHTNNGWWESIGVKERRHVKARLHAEPHEKPNQLLMRAAMESVCDTCVLTMQDVLDLGAEARMNVPSTTGGNWTWRAKPGYLDEPESEELEAKAGSRKAEKKAGEAASAGTADSAAAAGEKKAAAAAGKLPEAADAVAKEAVEMTAHTEEAATETALPERTALETWLYELTKYYDRLPKGEPDLKNAVLTMPLGARLDGRDDAEPEPEEEETEEERTAEELTAEEKTAEEKTEEATAAEEKTVSEPEEEA